MSDKARNIYFASDFHLGAPGYQSSRERENRIVAWLDFIKPHAAELYLLGDVFDFWFEYKKVIPKGFIRLQGKLAEMADSGIKIYIFKGNHDLWLNDYFKTELQAEIISKPLIKQLGNHRFYLAHGDGLGPGDLGFKFIKRIFTGKLNKLLFRWFHPDLGIPLADFFSGKSRAAHYIQNDSFLGEDEWLVMHSRNILEKEKIDYFIYGHRHFPQQYQLDEQATFINLGDMISHFTYAVYDGEKLELKKL